MAVICSKDLIDVRDNYKSICAEMDGKLYSTNKLLNTYKEIKKEYEDLLSDINEDQSELLKILIPSLFGSIYFFVSSRINYETDSKYFCLILSLIFISTLIEYINGIKNYCKNIDAYDNNNYNISGGKLDISYYTFKKKQALQEIEKLDLAIEIIDSLTEEERERYLILK